MALKCYVIKMKVELLYVGEVEPTSSERGSLIEEEISYAGMETSISLADQLPCGWKSNSPTWGTRMDAAEALALNRE